MTSLTSPSTARRSTEPPPGRDAPGRARGWLGDAVSAWSAYGLTVFAALMVVAWWRARRSGATAALAALAGTGGGRGGVRAERQY